MTPGSSLTGGSDGEGAADLDRFIFNWFNERDCIEMRKCLEAYDARSKATPTPEGEQS